MDCEKLCVIIHEIIMLVFSFHKTFSSTFPSIKYTTYYPVIKYLYLFRYKRRRPAVEPNSTTEIHQQVKGGKQHFSAILTSLLTLRGKHNFYIN